MCGQKASKEDYDFCDICLDCLDQWILEATRRFVTRNVN